MCSPQRGTESWLIQVEELPIPIQDFRLVIDQQIWVEKLPIQIQNFMKVINPQIWVQKLLIKIQNLRIFIDLPMPI